MNKVIAIVAGEPNSISSEIIFKAWKSIKKNKRINLIIIGSVKLLELQKKKLKQKIKIKEIQNNFNIKKFKKNEMQVINVNFSQTNPFQKISNKSNKYIFKCFDVAINLIKLKKIYGLINCPIAKEKLFHKKYQGITEFISKKFKSKGKEVMLLYNKNLSVSPLTTHISINKISKNITKNKIINNVKTISKFYKKNFKIKPKFGILGLNPHNYSGSNYSEEDAIIRPSIRILKKLNMNVIGPISPDSSFMYFKKYNVDVIIGMYHDQVLSPFKALYKHDAINITLGLPYVRISPDHGVGENIMGKNLADPKSLILSINFFNKIN